MIRFGLLALTVLPSAHAEPSVVRRLQMEQDVFDRRRNVIDSITNPFDYVFNSMDWLDDIEDFFVDVGDFFTEDVVHFMETDLVKFMKDIKAPIGGGLDDVDWVKTWDDFVHGMEEAWEWTEGAAETVWEWTEEGFCEMEGFMDDIRNEEGCTKCQMEHCEKEVDDVTIDQIDDANAVALSDMNNEFDPLFEGCANAMKNCPSIEDCKALSALTGSAQQYVSSEIAKCNLCYECLPYGSTVETCQIALDTVMPNNCKGCTESQQQMYNLFYSCSSLKALHDSIAKLGKSYSEGGDGNEFNNKMCENCLTCLYVEIPDTCDDWTEIKKQERYENGQFVVIGWDCMPPEIPNQLLPNGTWHPTWAPTPGPPTETPIPEPTTRPTRASPPPIYAGDHPSCASAMQPRTVGGITYGSGACCRCWSDEYPYDWDNGTCCRHCPACQGGR